MTWVSAIGGGVLGSVMTYGLTWFRERRRMLDAYRAPQRQAVSDIMTATHEFMFRQLEWRAAQEGLMEHLRYGQSIQNSQPSMSDEGNIRTASLSDKLIATGIAFGEAILAVERALQIGNLTVVDEPCLKAMRVCEFCFTRTRSALVELEHDPPRIPWDNFADFAEGQVDSSMLVREFDARVRRIRLRVDAPGKQKFKDTADIESTASLLRTVSYLADEFHESVFALVAKAVERISPADSFRNRRRRFTAAEQMPSPPSATAMMGPISLSGRLWVYPEDDTHQEREGLANKLRVWLDRLGII